MDAKKVYQERWSACSSVDWKRWNIACWNFACCSLGKIGLMEDLWDILRRTSRRAVFFCLISVFVLCNVVFCKDGRVVLVDLVQ